VVAELAIAIAVLVVTAFLVNAVPARQAVALPFATSWTTLGVQVNADVSPARVGPGNVVHIYVLSAAGRPNAVPELDATLTPPDSSIGPITVPLRLVSPGHYSAERVDFPIPGTWVLKVKIRTTAIDEDVVQALFGVH
jgi:copper transport protein